MIWSKNSFFFFFFLFFFNFILIEASINVYKQGESFFLFFAHTINAFLGYSTFFIVLLILTFNYFKLINIIKNSITYIMFYLGLTTTTTTLFSGFFWSISHWGVITIFDLKIIIIIIITIFFIACFFINILNNFFILYNYYVMYNIPILKYNVNWFNQLHQKKTISFNTACFTTNLSNILYIIIFFYLLLFVFKALKTNNNKFMNDYQYILV